MARLETWYKQDLKKPLIVHKHSDVFNQDNRGNLIGVEMYSNGEPVTLAGSISGYCLLADGTTVPAVGASRSGNKASVLIPQTAYGVPGPITITIKNVEGNDIATLCAVVGLVRQSVSGNLVNPGSVVTDWSNSINAQLQAVQTAADNVGAIVAAPFDENTVYVVGNYVTNNGNLYRITADHAAGVTWANTAKTQCTVGTELYGLKSALGLQKDISLSGESHTNGILGSAEIRDATYSGKNNVFQEVLRIDVKASELYTIKIKLSESPQQNVYVYFIDSDGNYVESSGSINAFNDANEHTITKTFANSHNNIILAIKTNSGCKISYASVKASETTIGMILRVDAELADKLESVDDSVNELYNTHIGKNLADPDKLTIGYLYSYGGINSNSNYRTTDYIPVVNGETYAIGSYSNIGELKSGRYGYLLYDSSKTPINDDYVNTDSIPGMAVTVNDSDAKYMRCFCQFVPGRTIMVCESESVPSEPEPYQETKMLAIKLDETPMDQVEEAIPDSVANILEKYEVPIEQTKQLFDRSKVTIGYCSNTGYIDPSTSYVYTEKIPVIVGKTIYFSVNGTQDSARFVCAYDANGSVVSASGSSSSVTSYTVPIGIAEIRLTYTNPASTAKYAHFQAEYDEITGFVPFGKYFNIDDYLGKDNVLWGKKWAVCGDSFTDGVLNTTIQTGRYTGQRIVYPYLIGNRNNMDIVKFFNGGQTLAFPATPGDFTNSLTYPSGSRYYQNIPVDVDYITIYLGINDANHATGTSQDGEDTTGEIPIGEITDNTTATYYGAWNVVLTWLITNRPNAHIGIIVTNGNSSDTYRQAQIAIAKKYGIPYIDMNGDSRTPAMLRTSNPDIASAVKTALIEKWRVSSTNTHPNDAAHEFESTFIENFLRSI